MPMISGVPVEPMTEQEWIQVHRATIDEAIGKALSDLRAGRLDEFYLRSYFREVEAEAEAVGYRQGRERYRTL